MSCGGEEVARLNKYGARSTEIDGYLFASKAEARRYEELRLLVIAGEITDLVVHPRFALYVPEFWRSNASPPPRFALCVPEFWRSNASPPSLGTVLMRTARARRVGYYTADFAYTRGAEQVVEDVKGGKATRTEAYKLRKKMVELTYGLKVTEVG